MRLRLGSETAPGTRADSPKRKSPAFTFPSPAALKRASGISSRTANVHAASADIGRKIAAWSISFLVNLMEAVEINTGPNPQAAVIWLYGLGADGHDVHPIVPRLRLRH